MYMMKAKKEKIGKLLIEILIGKYTNRKMGKMGARWALGQNEKLGLGGNRMESGG